MFEFEKIPQMDLMAQYAAIGGEICEAVIRVMASQRFVLGTEGAALESDIAELYGVKHGIGVASGTDALILALRAVGVSITMRFRRREWSDIQLVTSSVRRDWPGAFRNPRQRTGMRL